MINARGMMLFAWMVPSACLAQGPAGPDRNRLLRDVDEVKVIAKALKGDPWAIRELNARGAHRYRDTLKRVAEGFSTGWEAEDSPYHRHSAQIYERRVRNEAKVYLSKIGESKYLDEFCVQLSTSDPGVKDDAISVLGQIGNLAAVKCIIGAIDDDSVRPHHSDEDVMSIGDAALGTLFTWIRPDFQCRGFRPSASIEEMRAWPTEGRPKCRLLWKRWWKENQKKYEKMRFEDGWIKEKPKP